MNARVLPTLLVILFFIVACNDAPVHRQTSDEDFKTLLDKSKEYLQTYPHQPDSALMILYELLPQQQGDEKAGNRAKVLNMMGAAYDIKSMNDSVAHYLYEAVRIAETLNYDSLLVSVYSNIGLLHFATKNASEAIKYHQQSLVLAEKLNDTIKIIHQLNNIGNTYMTLTNAFEDAVPYFERCMELSDKTGYALGYKVAAINLIQIYDELGEHDKAMQEIQRITENYGQNIYADFTLGSIYFKQGNYKAALREWKALLKKSLNTRELELILLKNIAEIYKISGNMDSAIAYLEQSYNLRDTIHNQQTYETINELKIVYETEKKDLTISALEAEKRQMTLMIWLGVAAVVVLLLALATFFLLWRWTVQKKRFSEQQVIRLEQEKQLIATQALLDGETQERTRLARDLHDGLGSILAAAKYNLADARKTPVTELINLELLDKALGLLDESMSEMRRVAHHLMPESLTRYGLKQAITDFCKSIPVAKFVYYGDESRLDPKINVMLYRIMHELVGNALKHSGASQILVQIVQEADRIALTVQDNGCGFDVSTQSNGMGLANIRNRVAAYNGNLLIDSTAGVGTEVNVELKVKN